MKRHSLPSAARGFTLIEVMITLCIVALLSAIAYPMYKEYPVKSNRGAAQSHLLQMSLAETQFFTDNRSYGTTAEINAMLPVPAAVSDKYTIEVTTVAGPPQSYTITATPRAGTNQADDVILTINSAGAKTPVGKW